MIKQSSSSFTITEKCNLKECWNSYIDSNGSKFPPAEIEEQDNVYSEPPFRQELYEYFCSYSLTYFQLLYTLLLGTQKWL